MFGFALALLEGAGIGVTASLAAAIVEPMLVWLCLILFACGRLVSHPLRVHEGAPAREFYWNWFSACAVLISATLMSFGASPALKEITGSPSTLLVGSLIFLGLALLMFGVIAAIIYNRAVRWSLSQAESYPAGRRFHRALAEFVLAQWRSLRGSAG